MRTPTTYLSFWLRQGHMRTPLALTQKSREACGFISWRFVVFHFLFSRRFDLFIQIIHLPLLLSSWDNLAGRECPHLSYLFCTFSLLICLEVTTCPHDLILLVGGNCGNFVFTGSKILPKRKKEIDYYTIFFFFWTIFLWAEALF